MFFRRERPKDPSFSERIDSLRNAGFAAASAAGGFTRVSQNGLAVYLKGSGEAVQVVAPPGVLIDDEIGSLVDGGYQKFFRTPSGKKRPALADDLKALHDFEEDVREGLGAKSLYNQSLGTVSTFYLYDRVKDRDSGHVKRVWD
jgi:hypothetical protein